MMCWEIILKEPDVYFTIRQRELYRFFFLPVLIITCLSASSQEVVRQEPIEKIRERKLSFNGTCLFLAPEKTARLSMNLIPPVHTRSERNHPLLDSLRSYVSKSLIASKIYNILVIPDNPGPLRISNEDTELRYSRYAGRRIRKIVVNRLEVFGTNINNPNYFDPAKIEKLLNKTHFNTNESIIRKNLLFSEGDSINPLIMSDNERIIRQLPYISDARILLSDAGDGEVDVLVVTRDVYSLGADFSYSKINKGRVSLFEKNIFGMGHEFGIEVPYDLDHPSSPGFGVKYNINNISRSFADLNLFFLNGLTEKVYGFALSRRLLSTTTKYAGGISFRQVITDEDLDTLSQPQPLRYNLQDYWISRSFLIDMESATRMIVGARYTNNIVSARPFIHPDSYYHLQNYRLYLGSAAFSVQKYYKTNLLYNYGRTEDVPYGGMIRITAGKEYSEFKRRSYFGLDASSGIRTNILGHLYLKAGLSTFISEEHTEQGLFSAGLKYFSNILFTGRSRIRNFVTLEYTRGFDRYTDEYLRFESVNGLSGFRNDSVLGRQRLYLSFESVLFSQTFFYGFRFAPFAFTDFLLLSAPNQMIGDGNIVSGIGLGIRIRNDNLIFSTFQIRLGFFPNLPDWSRTTNIIFSGEQLLKPDNFDPGPPAVLPYR